MGDRGHEGPFLSIEQFVKPVNHKEHQGHEGVVETGSFRSLWLSVISVATDSSEST